MNKSISKIINYGKENYMFLICIFFLLLLIYGIKVFNFTIGIDSDIYYMDTYDMFYKWHAREWRYGITLIQLLFLGTSKLNQYFSNFLSVFFLGISCFFWCYVLNEYYKKNTIATLFFIIFYLASIVWLEIMYFSYMSFACFFSFAILPLGVVLLDDAIINKSRLSLLLSLIILVLCLSTYQPMGALYLAGILIILFGHIENDRLSKDIQWNYFIKTICFLIGSILIYFLVSLFVTRIVFKVDLDSYVSNTIGGGVSFLKRLKNLLVFLYSITLGELNCFNDWFLIKIFKLSKDFVELIKRISLRGSLAFLPAVCFYIYNIIKRILYNHNKYSIIYLLVSSGILGSAILINLLGDGISTPRYMHAFPLVYSFLLFFTICNVNKSYIKYATTIFFILCAFRFCFRTTLLQESDIRRYAYDVELSNNINYMIQNKYSNKINEDTKVLLIGRFDYDYGENYLKGDIIGNSAVCFGCESSLIESTLRAVPFMKALGYNYNGVDLTNDDLLDLREYSVKMPKYPDNGCVDLYKNVIIVKLNDFSFGN